jgi:hypothetical protein
MVRCFDENAGLGSKSKRHTPRRAVNNGNEQSCQTCLRKFPQIISTKTMNSYFIVPRWTVPRYKRAILRDSKKAVDRVTVLCCSNRSGIHKRKMLVTAKRLSLGGLRGQAWTYFQFCAMSTKVRWWHWHLKKKKLLSWDVELQQTSRKILPALDNFTAYHHSDCVRYTQQEFLSRTQPWYSQWTWEL